MDTAIAIEMLCQFIKLICLIGIAYWAAQCLYGE